MMWIIYAFLTAFFSAVKGVAGKKSMRSLDEYVVAFFMHIFAGCFIAGYFLFNPIPALGNMFWTVLIVDCLLSALAAVWSTKALISEFSTTVPLTAFTPLLLLLTSYLMLGEVPSLFGFVGVVLIVIGVYILNIRERKNGWSAPLRALVKRDGARLMLASTFIWSLTANLDKMAVQNSSPIFFAMAECFLIGLFIFPVAAKRIRRQKKEIRKERIHLAAMSLFTALMLICQMIAISQTLVVYVNSIKRLGILISIALGGLVFKEKDMGLKLVGGCVMVLGVLFITLL